LSGEHRDIHWLPYNEAYDRLTWDSNRNALWELNERLTGRAEAEMATDKFSWPEVDPGYEHPDLWTTLQDLVDSAQIVIDRPTGSAHPRFRVLVYPFDYGYLDGTSGGDSDGFDCWVGGGGTDVVGLFVTVDLGKRDAEVKLLIGCSPEQIDIIAEFYRPQPQRVLLVCRPQKAGARTA